MAWAVPVRKAGNLEDRREKSPIDDVDGQAVSTAFEHCLDHSRGFAATIKAPLRSARSSPFVFDQQALRRCPARWKGAAEASLPGAHSACAVPSKTAETRAWLPVLSRLSAALSRGSCRSTSTPPDPPAGCQAHTGQRAGFNLSVCFCRVAGAPPRGTRPPHRPATQPGG